MASHAPLLSRFCPSTENSNVPDKDSQIAVDQYAGKKVTIIRMMQERDIFDERQEIKKANYSCPFCRERNDYDIRWMTRVKKRNVPRQMTQDDRARFEKSRDYMVRIDDQLMCMNIRCRKRFEIPSSQTVVFI